MEERLYKFSILVLINWDRTIICG